MHISTDVKVLKFPEKQASIIANREEGATVKSSDGKGTSQGNAFSAFFHYQI